MLPLPMNNKSAERRKLPMQESINKKLNAMQPRKRAILCVSAKLFSQNNFNAVSNKMIGQKIGLPPGSVTYYFRTKEGIALDLYDILSDYQNEMTEKLYEETKDGLLTLAIKIAAQVTLCEENTNALLLYRTFYALPAVYESIKSTASKITYKLMKNDMPDWTEKDFKIAENVTSSIEMSALSSFSSSYFTLDDKISQILHSVMHIYKVPEDKQTEIMIKLKKYDCSAIGKEMFDRFIKLFDGDRQNE